MTGRLYPSSPSSTLPNFGYDVSDVIEEMYRISMIPKLTIASVFIFLRQELLEAREQENKAELQRLSHTLDLLYDAAVEAEDGPLIGLTEDLSYSVNHWLMGVDWKDAIPTEEELKQRLSDPKRISRLNTAGLFIFLRNTFFRVRAQKDETGVSALMAIFGHLEDAACIAGDTDAARFAFDLLYSTIDIGLSEWKSTIPTEEELKRLLADHD